MDHFFPGTDNTLTVEVRIRARAKYNANEDLANTVTSDLASVHGPKLCASVVGGINDAAYAKGSALATLQPTWETACLVNSGDVSWTAAAGTAGTPQGDYGLLQFTVGGTRAGSVGN